VHPRYGEAHEAVFEIKEPADFPEGATFTLLLDFQDGVPGHGIGRFRLSASDEMPSATTRVPSELAIILGTPANQRTPTQRQDSRWPCSRRKTKARWPPCPRHNSSMRSRRISARRRKLQALSRAAAIHLLARGDLARPGELIGPARSVACPNATRTRDHRRRGRSRAPRRTGAMADRRTQRPHLAQHREPRLALSLRPRHLRHAERLGKMGGTPSHPELLDWLAVWFRDDAKGSIKALHRLIVTSATYRQSSEMREEKSAKPGDHFARVGSTPTTACSGGRTARG